MKFCTNCGRQNDPSQTFCVGCGTPLPAAAPGGMPDQQPAGAPQGGGYGPPPGGGYGQPQGGFPPPQAGFAQQPGGFPPPQGGPIMGQGPMTPGVMGKPKSAPLAAVIGLFLPGIGQWYATGIQQQKGIAMFVAAIAVNIIGRGLGSIHALGFLGCIISLVGLAYAIYSAIDAYQIAQKVNSGQMVGPWEFTYFGNIR